MTKRDITDFIKCGEIPLGFSHGEAEFYLRVFTGEFSTHTSYKYKDDEGVNSWRFPIWDEEKTKMKMEFVDYGTDLCVFETKKDSIEENLVDLMQWWEASKEHFTDIRYFAN